MTRKIRILFLGNNILNSEHGGLERTKSNLIKYLQSTEKYEVGAAFTKIEDDLPGAKIYENVYKDGYDMMRVVNDFNADVVIFPYGPWYVNEFVKHNRKSGIKVITAYHSPPKFSFKYKWLRNHFDFSNKSAPKRAISFPKYLVANAFIIKEMLRSRRLQREGYLKSDAYVLLSNKFFSEFKNFTGISDTSKLYAIGNALSFKDCITEEERRQKKKEVLVVSRLDEVNKRISLALKAWQKIKHDGWVLNILGDGVDRDFYHNMVEADRISDVVFHGRCDPLPFYKSAKIFLMTSDEEGWGMTLTESLQMGVVPIATDGNSPFAEIIQDGLNGFIVSNNDIDNLADAIKMLMEDENRLDKMSAYAVKSSAFFSTENIGKKWINILSDLEKA